MPFDFEQSLKTIPHQAGVYLMKDRRGQVFYVGKAKDLYKRLRQYASGQDERAFVAKLGDLLDKIDVILTNSEREALILEAGLIKRYRPRFNVILNDDKDLPQIRFDLQETWPRLEIVRHRKNDGAHYFGPYPNAQACRMTLAVINRHFKLRSCSNSYFANRSRPCLQYEMHRCPAPCVFSIDRQEYLQQCEDVEMFLSGKLDALKEKIQARMLEAAELLAFEKAARYRDQLKAIEEVCAKQNIVQKSPVHQDYWAYHGDDKFRAIVVMIVRFGRLQQLQSYEARDAISTLEEIFSQILVHHYQSLQNFPSELIFPEDLGALIPILSETLSDLAEREIKISLPKRGIKVELFRTTQLNAKQQYLQRLSANDDRLARVQAALELRRYPQRIECYDISNLQDNQIVSAMVVYIGGKLDPARCRSFKLRHGQGQDDFKSLHEVLSRRLRYLQTPDGDETLPAELAVPEKSDRSFLEAPDLLLIDGGHGQVRAVMQAVREAKLEGSFDVVGIAKSRTLEAENDIDVDHSPESFIKPNKKKPIILDQSSDVVLLMAEIRNETHRRAIGFHRKRRQVETFKSRLDEIEGIGPKRKRKLLQAFGSLREIARQSPEMLAQTAGLSLELARKVKDFLRPHTRDNLQD